MAHPQCPEQSCVAAGRREFGNRCGPAPRPGGDRQNPARPGVRAAFWCRLPGRSVLADSGPRAGGRGPGLLGVQSLRGAGACHRPAIGGDQGKPAHECCVPGRTRIHCRSGEPFPVGRGRVARSADHRRSHAAVCSAPERPNPAHHQEPALHLDRHGAVGTPPLPAGLL